MQAKRGIFIVFEGLDRVGKTTQAQKLTDYFTSKAQSSDPSAAPCFKLNYPNRQSQSGQLLDQYLKNKTGDGMGNEAVHLLFSMNRWENKQQLVNTLNEGRNVVCDRYAFSGVTYSVAKGLDFEWCMGADRGLIQPDLVVYFNASAEELALRSGFGEERFERIEFQQLVDQAYGNFKAQGITFENFMAPEYAPPVPNRWVNLSVGEDDIEIIHEKVKALVEKYESNFRDSVNTDEINKGLFR